MEQGISRRLASCLILLGALTLACAPEADEDTRGTSAMAMPGEGGTGSGDSGGFGVGDAAADAGAAMEPGTVADSGGAGVGDAGASGTAGGGALDAGSSPRRDAGSGSAGGADASPPAVSDAGAAGTTDGGTTAPPAGQPIKSAGCGTATPLKSGTYTINVGSSSRTYILRVPDGYDANRAYRLILAYHPLNGTAQQISSGNFYGLWSMAAGSTIFAAPQGINNAWPDSGRSRTTGGQDIAFTKALFEELTGKLCIDRSRMFAEGFSMGGSMSYAIACALPDLVRAVVVHSGGPMSGCVQHTKPVAYFMTHGTTDNVCTYPEYGVPQINEFAMLNGCMPRAMPMPSGTTPACVDFMSCMPSSPTRACIFVGGHTPSPSGNWVPKESWQFIAQF